MIFTDTYLWQSHTLWHCGSDGTQGTGRGRSACTLLSGADLLERERERENIIHHLDLDKRKENINLTRNQMV